MDLKLDSRYNFLIPYDVPMIRLGDIGDCGYVIPEKVLEAKNLISLGIGTNWSFDKQWQEHKPYVVIHAFDGTVFPEQFDQKLKEEYESFFKGKVKHFRENVSKDNIDSILKSVSGPTFLKMDIEGFEYDIIDNIANAKHLIGMAIEFHALDIDTCKQNFISAIEKFSNYKIVHLHANNFGGVCDDFLPHTIVISFLRNDLCDSDKKRHNVYLNGLDSPNALNSEEYMLYFIGEE